MKQLPRGGRLFFLFAAAAIFLKRYVNSVKHILLAKRLGQELNRSGSYRLHRHRNVAMPGNEDDRNGDSGVSQFGLKIKSAQSWQSNVEHQATGDIGKLVLQEIRCRFERLDLQVDGSQKTLES